MSESKAGELKPCPFCGSNPYSGSNMDSVYCCNPYCWNRYNRTSQKNWNNRAIETVLSGAQKEIARLNEQAAGYALERAKLETELAELREAAKAAIPFLDKTYYQSEHDLYVAHSLSEKLQAAISTTPKERDGIGNLS